MTKIKNKNNNERKDAKQKRSNKPQYETKKLKTNKPRTSDKKTIHGRKKHTKLFKSLFCCFY